MIIIFFIIRFIIQFNMLASGCGGIRASGARAGVRDSSCCMAFNHTDEPLGSTLCYEACDKTHETNKEHSKERCQHSPSGKSRGERAGRRDDWGGQRQRRRPLFTQAGCMFILRWCVRKRRRGRCSGVTLAVGAGRKEVKRRVPGA